jgi:hypothetical protein
MQACRITDSTDASKFSDGAIKHNVPNVRTGLTEEAASDCNLQAANGEAEERTNDRHLLPKVVPRKSICAAEISSDKFWYIAFTSLSITPKSSF